MSTVTDILAKIGVEPGDKVDFGVPGMHWGVRNERRRTAKADAKFEKESHSVKTWIKVHNAAAEKMNNGEIDRINNKPEYKGADFTKPSELRTKYYNEMQETFLIHAHAAATAMGTNASGTRKLGIIVNQHGDWGVSPEDVEHDAGDMMIKVNKNSKGFIISLEVMAPLVQGVSYKDGDLLQFGVLGMKWGRRRSKAELEAAKSTDARKLEGAKAKSKDTKIASLSNDELQQAIRRMNLERDFQRLANPESAGKKFMKKWFSNPQNRNKTAEQIGVLGGYAVAAHTLGNQLSKDPIDVS